MKKVILDKRLYSELLDINLRYDSFCTVINCSLIKLHEGAELYACIRSHEGIPCKLYVADERDSVEARIELTEKEWIEAIGDEGRVSVFLCVRTASGDVLRTRVLLGTQAPDIDETLCHTMERLSTENNNVLVISNEKKYCEADMEALRKRSVIDLSAIDSREVDIIYFGGAERLIEKLIYGGCKELTVFITDTNKAGMITERIEAISKKAPFSNRITVVVGEAYAPKRAAKLLVGNSADLPDNAASRVFFSVNSTGDTALEITVGQNVTEADYGAARYKIKPHTVHYVTSIMSELVLHAVANKNYRAKRLFRVDAKTLETKTIIKED